jgi:hypothetical protein
MLATHANYQKLAPFRVAHPGVAVDGDGFFTAQTRDELQAIIDQTLTSLKKKRELTGARAGARTAANTMLRQAGTADTVNVVTVRWGMHQDNAGPARGSSGATTWLRHFTVIDPAGGNDWHIYCDDAMNTIMYLSQNAGVFVKVDNA